MYILKWMMGLTWSLFATYADTVYKVKLLSNGVGGFDVN